MASHCASLGIYEAFPEPPTTRSIRLCRLFPARSRTDDIRCELFITSLDANEDFEALSYTWGDSEHTRSILVGDQEHLVTQDLACALTHLRHTEKERTLWIDALCINQHDVSEKSAQVRRMKDVYGPGGARRVVIWLGAIPNARKAVDFCKRMQDLYVKQGQWTTDLRRKRAARAAYINTPLQELPRDDATAQKASQRFAEYLDSNGAMDSIHVYLSKQTRDHKLRLQVEREWLEETCKKPSGYTLDARDRVVMQRRTLEAASLLLSEVTTARAALTQGVPGEQSASRTGKVERSEGSSVESDSHTSGQVASDEESLGKRVWKRLMQNEECRHAAQVLWEKVEEELELKLNGDRKGEMEQEHKEEDHACHDLFVRASWWSQMWILQEVIHGGEVAVLLSQGDDVDCDVRPLAYLAVALQT